MSDFKKVSFFVIFFSFFNSNFAYSTSIFECTSNNKIERIIITLNEDEAKYNLQFYINDSWISAIRGRKLLPELTNNQTEVLINDKKNSTNIRLNLTDKTVIFITGVSKKILYDCLEV